MWRWMVVMIGGALTLVMIAAEPQIAANESNPSEQDYRRMLQSLGLKELRSGVSGNASGPKPANYDETVAGPEGMLPNPLQFTDGKRVKTAKDWVRRRSELLALFDRDVYGEMPERTPAVRWEIVNIDRETVAFADAGGVQRSVPVVTKHLIGHVAAAEPAINVAIKLQIELNLTTPAEAAGRVPVMMEFGYRFAAPKPGQKALVPPTAPSGPTWQQQVLQRGWGYAVFYPTSVQADNGAGLEEGVIGLVNRGQPRKQTQWGSLRAWAWGASRALDYFATDTAVDAKQVGIEGHSRFGKAALVTMAYDPRFAIAYVSSSGAGGAELWRRNFGEQLENVASVSEYHWMAGNFLKYAADPLHARDLPVDQHELIALCAPRPVFIGGGAKGDAWVDAHGMFLAAVAASPVYALLGKKGVSGPEGLVTAFPVAETSLINGDLAYRQHAGGHTPAPNWPAFLEFAGRYLHVDAPER